MLDALGATRGPRTQSMIEQMPDGTAAEKRVSR
jgi:hypothetical protein